MMLNDLNNDFTERKRVITAKKEEERGAGKRGVNLDGVSLTDLEEFKGALKIDGSALEKLHRVDTKDLVLSESPVDFVTKLHFHMTRPGNHILEQDVKEEYVVTPQGNSGTVPTSSIQIEVTLTHNMFEVETKARMLIDLALDDKKQLVVRFRRDEEESMDSLTFIRLSSYIRETFKE